MASFPSHSRDLSARLPRRARVLDRVALTSTGTVLVDFEVVDAEPFTFAPGQFVAVDFDNPRLGYRRSPYCLYGASSNDRKFTLLVRVVPVGPVSVFLGGLQRGDVISFRGPSGHSMRPPDDEHLVLIPTGVGIGPCLLLLHELAAGDPIRSVDLFWGLRQAEDICLTSELELLESDLVNLRWEVSLSDPPKGWTGLRGRVTQSVPPLLERLEGHRFYLVSNGQMVAELGAALREMGVASKDIHEESFFEHRHKPSAETVQEIKARFVATDLESPLLELERRMRRNRRTL